MTGPRILARRAGLLYLAVTLGGGFNELYVRPRVVTAGDPAATADHIRASATLFRVGFVSDLVADTCWLLTAFALYMLFREIDRFTAFVMVTLVAVGAAIGGLNLLNQYTALTVATGAEYRHGLGPDGSDALAQLFAIMQRNGFLVGAMFFGLWLAPLGYLVIRSGYVPKMLGWLLVGGCFGYLGALFTDFLAPGLGRVGFALTGFGGLTEVVFVLWLLFGPVRVPAPDGPAPAPAAAGQWARA